jgi:hypothetical protein
MESIYKREIMAGIAGGIIVFLLFVLYYVCNGLIKYKKDSKAIN